MPNFDRLRTLHDWIMHNVPPEQFNLNFVWQRPCGCAIGWARKVPGFDEAGLVARHNAVGWPSAATWFFDISGFEAMFLFGGPRRFETPQHKSEWHGRMVRFFAQYGEPLNKSVTVAGPEPTRVVPGREPALVD